MSDPLATVYALCRRNLHPFVQKVFETTNPGAEFMGNWHLHALAWHLEQCVTGDIRRLIITVPPRSLKSVCSSIALPLWILGKDPSRQIINVSYSEELALTFSRQRQLILESNWLGKVFPGFATDISKNTEREFVTAKNGGCFTTSIGGTLTGRGADVIIIDDPHKVEEAASEAARNKVAEWYRGTCFTRLNNKNDGVVIVIMQRCHADDLVGSVVDIDDWTILDLPAIARDDEEIRIGDQAWYRRNTGDVLHPERESLETLVAIQRTVGSTAFEAQYQQAPVPADGNMIKRGWFQRHRLARLHRQEFELITQSWDTAFKGQPDNDYSVCTTWGVAEGRFYLIDVFRKKLGFPDLLRAVRSQATKYSPHAVLIESTGSGTSLLQTLHKEDRLPVRAIPQPRHDKETRVSQVSAIIEDGRVLLPADAPWLSAFEHEVLAFPSGKHDDQVDSMTQFLKWYHFERRTPVQVRVTAICGGSSIGGTYFERNAGSRLW